MSYGADNQCHPAIKITHSPPLDRCNNAGGFVRRSIRIGAAQQMVGYDPADATQAGRWKASARVARYDSTSV
jgi:hypothetical protein